MKPNRFNEQPLQDLNCDNLQQIIQKNTNDDYNMQSLGLHGIAKRYNENASDLSTLGKIMGCEFTQL